MASLFKPLNRCLVQFRQANNAGLLSVMQQRFKSDKPASTGNLEKPLEKKAVDPLADPKESCNHFTNIILLLIKN
jgi:hypothetical protein